MKNYFSPSFQRNPHGMSLIEMLSALFITSFIAAGITGLAISQNVVAFRVFNKMDSLTNARRAAAMIERDIRSARIIGDQFGTLQDCNQFPAANNTQYTISGSSLSTFLGYPQTTSNSQWTPPPYILNAQTLIVQVPIFLQDGIPSQTDGHWNVDTVVYRIVADSAKPKSGRFILQRAFFPGEHQNGYIPTIASNSPQTLLTGIVGPIDQNGAADSTAGVPAPKVFAYINKLSPLYQSALDPTKTPTPAEAANINGVCATFEVYSDIVSKRQDMLPRSIAFHREIFLRGNYNSTP